MLKNVKQSKQELTEQQQRFIQAFIDFAYENMNIENETPFTREEAYARYYNDALDLVKDGTYQNVKLG